MTTPHGKKPILKAMMTTACEKNCFYCPFRAGRAQTNRVTFTPDEMASSFDLLQRSGVVDGMFLSSGIIKGGVTAQDKIIDTAEIVRKKYSYRGYIHLKVMPGAEYDQIRRAMQLADRVSINLEGPTPQRLEALAPKKDYWEEIFTRVQWIARLREQERLRASVVTQFVVGAVGDTDLELLQLSELLYGQYQLRRAYYSAFHPVAHTPFENLAPTAADARAAPLPGIVPAARLRLERRRSALWPRYEPAAQHRPQAGLGTREPGRHAGGDQPRRPRRAAARARASAPRRPMPSYANAAAARIREVSHLSALGLRDAKRAAPYILLDGQAPARQMALF